MRLNVTDLTWEEIRKYIYPQDGTLPDIWVPNITYDDWRKWAEFVNATYPVRFRDAAQQEHDRIDIAAVLVYWRGDRLEDMPFASVFVEGIQINCFFLAEDSLDGDINPREIQSLEAHLALLQYLSTISHLLAKPIMLLDEGARVNTNGQFEPEPLLVVTQDQAYTNTY